MRASDVVLTNVGGAVFAGRGAGDGDGTVAPWAGVALGPEQPTSPTENAGAVTAASHTRRTRIFECKRRKEKGDSRITGVGYLGTGVSTELRN